MHPRNTRTASGFTIIEILIVLTVAGLILVIIFLAVPALNRNHRNLVRKETVNYISAQMQEYNSENESYPLAGPNPGQDNRPDFITDLGSNGPSKLYTIRYVDNSSSHDYPYVGADAPADASTALDEISIIPGHKCNTASGNPGDSDYPLMSVSVGDNNYQSYAVWTQLEGARIYCVSNF